MLLCLGGKKESATKIPIPQKRTPDPFGELWCFRALVAIKNQPPKLQYTKKEHQILLVNFGAFVPWWQKRISHQNTNTPKKNTNTFGEILCFCALVAKKNQPPKHQHTNKNNNTFGEILCFRALVAKKNKPPKHQYTKKEH